ncbi:dienelactone hydrolase family protein [Antrihabitans sp. YC3-6]|uniref:Dienelactone hydrolase family protein n=1 Tax=Antrihabitans stalagmiti TaxID=2799499 RepID=A0A934NRK6_9NOCA|nr:dienelactone hydrolase family protein [Antrihabitans stalagmiti]MBJ8340024.1 dienelactone hydrolase family protein [Antrihabitans stalagmiti]
MSGIFEDTAVERTNDGDETASPGTVPVSAIEPDGHARGGIVVLHESRDFTPALLGLMRALADEGWIAVAPHLFHREPEDSAAEVFGDNLFRDFDASFDWLRAKGVFADCIGVLGFDDAGTAAVLVATNRPVGAVVSVAARGIVEPITAGAQTLLDAVQTLQAPWLALYGFDDPETPSEHVERLRDAVATASVATNVVSYAGLGHRADEETAAGDIGKEFESGADVLLDAQSRIFDWFDSNLR